jgi:putative lipoic acid-binding regulatory protein
MKKTTNTEDSTKFPFTQFPFKVVHMEGKDMMDKKICYFQNQQHVDKYITRSKFKSKDYQLYIKPGTNVEDLVQSTRRKSKQKKS